MPDASFYLHKSRPPPPGAGPEAETQTLKLEGGHIPGELSPQVCRAQVTQVGKKGVSGTCIFKMHTLREVRPLALGYTDLGLDFPRTPSAPTPPRHEAMRSW